MTTSSPPLSLAELLPDRSLPAIAIRGVTDDSAAVSPGDLFAALPGARVHGAHFAPAALAAGAAAILTDPAGVRLLTEVAVPVAVVEEPRRLLGPLACRLHGDPSRSLRVIGVTGTNGKTTVTWFIAAGLAAAGVPTAVLGTLGARFQGEVLPLAHTTPTAPTLQRTLAGLRDRSAAAVAMEVSSHALAQYRVDGTHLAAAVFTNLSQDHLDFHGDMAAYFAAKRRLFTPDFTERAIVCIDDEWGQGLAELIGGEVACTTVSRHGRPADWWVTGEDYGGSGTRATVHGPMGEVALALRMPGPVNLANAVLAAAVLSDLGVAGPEIAAGLAQVQVPGRMERVSGAEGPAGIVDYAHTPHAIEAACASARAVLPSAGRLIVILGAGGGRDAGKRAGMGAAAASHADLVIVTDDNPRDEDPAAIRAQVRAGAEILTARAEEVLDIADRGAAIAHAAALAGEQDTVLLLGKGHEQSQEKAGERAAFDDRVVLAAALRARGGQP